jgi:hypothetical protein
MKIANVVFNESLDTTVFLWEMANLTKPMTGLPMNIYISTKDSVNDRHGPRIKVMTSHGNRVIPEDLTSISISLTPIDFQGNMKPDDFSHVVKFIQMNYTALLQFWNNEINISEFLNMMKKQDD